MDAGRAAERWEHYVGALRDHGWRIEEAPTADEHPDGVFVEDAAVVLRGVAVLTRPGAPHGAGKSSRWRGRSERLGLEPRITDPGELDGGDVMSAGDTMYVGVGGRTNAEGVRQLGEALAPAGMTVVSVPLGRVLHLKSAATVLPGGTVIGYPDALDDPAVFPRFLPAPEEPGAHVVRLGDNAVLMATGAPREALLRQQGLRPVSVDIGGVRKGRGLRDPACQCGYSPGRDASGRTIGSDQHAGVGGLRLDQAQQGERAVLQ